MNNVSVILFGPIEICDIRNDEWDLTKTIRALILSAVQLNETGTIFRTFPDKSAAKDGHQIGNIRICLLIERVPIQRGIG
jgi:hypothetical protein